MKNLGVAMVGHRRVLLDAITILRAEAKVLVQIEDADEKPLAADAPSLTLSNPDKKISPITGSGRARVGG